MTSRHFIYEIDRKDFPWLETYVLEEVSAKLDGLLSFQRPHWRGDYPRQQEHRSAEQNPPGHQSFTLFHRLACSYLAMDCLI
jgi:hypothetical protein